MHVQRAARAFERLRLLAGDEVTDLIARKPRIVRELARMETRLAGRVLPDGLTARAYVCPPCFIIPCSTLALLRHNIRISWHASAASQFAHDWLQQTILTISSSMLAESSPVPGPTCARQ